MAQTCFKLQVLRVRAPILTEIAPSSIFSYHMRVESTKSNLLVAKLKTKCLLPVSIEKKLINILLERKNFVLVKFYTCKPCTSIYIESKMLQT